MILSYVHFPPKNAFLILPILELLNYYKHIHLENIINQSIGIMHGFHDHTRSSGNSYYLQKMMAYIFLNAKCIKCVAQKLLCTCI